LLYKAEEIRNRIILGDALEVLRKIKSSLSFCFLECDQELAEIKLPVPPNKSTNL
jgi:hypothetical protein